MSYRERYKILSTTIVEYKILDVETFNQYRGRRDLTSLVKFSAVTESGVELKSTTGEVHFVGGNETAKTHVSGEIKGLTSDEIKKTSFVVVEWSYKY